MPKRRRRVSLRNHTANAVIRAQRRRKRAQRNPATLVWNGARGPATADVYMLGRDKYEIDVANDASKHTYSAPTRDSALVVAREKLAEFAMTANPIWPFKKEETYHARIIRTGGGSRGTATRSRKAASRKAAAASGLNNIQSDVQSALMNQGVPAATAKNTVTRMYRAGDSFDTLFRRAVSKTNPGTFNPAKFDRCVKEVQARGGDANAYAVCTAAGTRNVRLRNPESEAATLSEQFHGRPPREVNEVVENVHYHENLMEIGPLIELAVETVSGYAVTLEFPPMDSLERVILAWSEDGSTPYIVGGDQEIDLAALHMDAQKYRKDLMVIGTIQSWVYYAEKEQDHWKGSEYFHTSREGLSADGTRHKVVADTDTTLLYDTRSKLLMCAGGEANLYDPEAGIVG